MSLLTVPRTIKWPFFLGDLLMLGLAWFFYYHAKLPMNGPTLTACIACVAIGAVFGILPFLLDYRSEIRLAESASLTTAVDQIQNMDTVANRIAQATSQWQTVHEHANEAVTAARKVSDQMTAEMKSFVEFFEKAQASERQHLTLEVDKLKRAESDWLNVLVRILDHVYALHSAAARSGQPKVIDQLTHFQLAVRDVARRVGLIPFEAEVGAPFDAKKHQLPDNAEVPDDSRIGATLATGFTFRGQMIRPVLVELEGSQTNAPPAPSEQSNDRPPDASSEEELAL